MGETHPEKPESNVRGVRDPSTGTWLVECAEHGPLFAVYHTGDDDKDAEHARQFGAVHLREHHAGELGAPGG